MKSVAHVVVTDNFAGTERYVTTAANETARRGWRVAVIGGEPGRMRAELISEVEWMPGQSAARAARSLASIGRIDICHAHLTLAESVAVALRVLHRGKIVSTRHIAAARGSSWPGKIFSPMITAGLDLQIAISDFVNAGTNGSANLVIHNGVPDCGSRWRPENRDVLVVQRLEPDKNTEFSLDVWQAGNLAELGWRLRIVGGGSLMAGLQREVRVRGLRGVELIGHVSDVRPFLDEAGIFLATTENEGLGLAVLEAMAAGIPVLAPRSGGLVEVMGLGSKGLYAPGDPAQAGGILRVMARSDSLRSDSAFCSRRTFEQGFRVDQSISKLLSAYDGLEMASTLDPL